MLCLAMEKRIEAERRDAAALERRDAERRGIEVAIKMGRLGGMGDALIADAVAREYGVDRALVEDLMASLAE